MLVFPVGLVSIAWSQSVSGGANAPVTPLAPAGGPLQGGLVVHLEAGVQTLADPVVVQLVGKDKLPVAITLNDAGKSPDVTAKDGSWAGMGSVSGSSVAVVVSTADITVDGGTISWSAASAPSITLVLEGTTLTQASAFTGPGSGSPTAAPFPSADGSAGGGRGAGPGSAPQSELIATAVEAEVQAAASDRWLYVAFGGCSLLLGVSAYFWFRGSDPSGPPAGVRLITERGIFGPGLPPLIIGTTRWVVSEQDEALLLHTLLERIARSRPVLVQALDAVLIEEVSGGPVYRTCAETPTALVDRVDDLLLQHRSLVVVVTAPATASATLPNWLRDLEDMVVLYALVREPPGVAEDGAGAVVHCERAAGEWVFRTASGAVRVADG